MRRFLSLFTMLMLCGVLAFAQSRVVSGRVTDKDGNGIPSASVTIKGTKGSGTIADLNGNYSLKVKDGAVLEITGSTIKPQSVVVGNQSVVNVISERVTGKLEDVVVTTTFNRKFQKRQLGTSTTVLTGKDITSAGSQNIAAALTGKVAGLEIRQLNSGVTGDVRLTLRSDRSLKGDNQALLIVDGTVMPSEYLNVLNNDDIASYNILKGAGAAAIYGNEASNGVIVITTNRGSKSNKPVINFNSKVNFETVSYMPKLQNEYGSYGGEDFYDIYGNPGYVPYENQGFGPRYNGAIVPLGAPVRVFNANGTYKDIVQYVPYTALPTEKAHFFENAVTTQNDISLSNGDEKGSFYISASDTRQQGTVPNDKSRRNTLKINTSKDIGSKMNIDFSFTYSRVSTDIAGGDFFQDRPVFWDVINQPAHAPLTSYKDIVNNPFATPSGFLNAYYGNPYWQTVNSRNKDLRNNFFGNIAFTYKLSKYVSAQYRVSYTGKFQDYEEFKKGVKFASWASIPAKSDFVIDGITYPASGSNPGTLGDLNPTGYRANTNTSRLQGDFLLTAKKDIYKNVNAELVLGTSAFQKDYRDNETGRDVNGSVNSYKDIGIWGPAYTVGNALSYYSQTKQRTVGAFGELTLSYKNYLFLKGSLRNDWDSRLEAGNRSFLYPAANLAYVFTDGIKGLQNRKTLSYGKVRLSYAKVGKVDLAPYQTRNIYQPPVGFPLGDISGFTSGPTFNNPGIKPEFTTELEGGLELGLLDNRISIDASVYQSKTTNQTIPVGISAATGRASAIQNVGELENKGLELDLKLSVIRRKNIDWKIGMNYTYATNIVNSIAPAQGIHELALSGTTTSGIYAIEGKPFPVIKATDWTRDPQGRIIVDKSSGLPTVNSTQTVYGTTQAPHRFGLNSSLRVGAITLSVSAEYRHGAYISNVIGSDLDFTGISSNTTRYNRQAFVIPNSSYFDGTKYVPNNDVVVSQNQWTFWSSTYNKAGSNYITSADFWKIRELVLSYEFPKNLFSNSKFIKGGSVSLFGRDLFMFRPSENIYADPEFSNTSPTDNGVGNTDINQTPTTRKIGFGINLTF